MFLLVEFEQADLLFMFFLLVLLIFFTYLMFKYKIGYVAILNIMILLQLALLLQDYPILILVSIAFMIFQLIIFIQFIKGGRG